MPTVFLVLIVAVLIGALLALPSSAVLPTQTSKLPRGLEGALIRCPMYRLRPTLFTPAERSFLGIVDSLGLPDVRVMGKVRLSDIFQPQERIGGSARQILLNKISMKHVDFLLLDTKALRPLAGIELDDQSHRHRSSTLARDAFVGEVFASAGLPLLRIPAQFAYDPNQLRVAIQTALSTTTDTGAGRS